MPQIGYQWLSRRFSVTPVHPFAVQSEIGKTRLASTDSDVHRQVYPEAYRPADTVSDHLTFALKYEGVHLEFLARLYSLPEVRRELEHWIAQEPTGAYARRACFLYEWLIEPLDAPSLTRGNYVDALDPDRFVVGKAVNNPRWRVRDNLPGNRDFCPVIRRTDAVRRAEIYDLAGRLATLEDDYGIDLI